MPDDERRGRGLNGRGRSPSPLVGTNTRTKILSIKGKLKRIERNATATYSVSLNYRTRLKIRRHGLPKLTAERENRRAGRRVGRGRDASTTRHIRVAAGLECLLRFEICVDGSQSYTHGIHYPES